MQRVVCRNCDHVLYEGEELRPPQEIIDEYKGKCPKCGKRLEFKPRDVEFAPSPHFR